MPRSPHLRGWEIYLDESERRGGYDVYGGLWMTAEAAKRTRDRIRSVRNQHAYQGEFKWTKVSGKKLSPRYIDFINMVMDQMASGDVRFSAIVIDRAIVDLKRYHEGSKELSYYKFFHLLLAKRAEPGACYRVVMDRRSSRASDPLSTLKRTVNFTVCNETSIRHDVITEVSAAASQNNDLLQAADVILGAVGFHVAELHERAGSSQAKIDLAARICAKANRRSLADPSRSPRHRPINVWRWSPRGG